MGAKRPVAPDTPIRSFPTPNVDDLVVVVDVDSRLPGYKPLDYGTPHPDQTRFPGAKLVYQEPLDGSDQFVRRIYATDRADQDAYNYAVKYSSGSPGHPIYIRTYVEPRASYTPLADGSPDSVFPDAFLVEEEMQPVEGELNSLYVKVSRVFETLPGPLLTSFETNEAGQKVTITTQRKSSADYSLPAASATSSPSAQAEDTGVVTEQIRSVPTIFTRKQFSAERPDMLPQKFRAAVPDVETSEIVAGTAVQPTLGQGDISASETQQSLFVKQVSRRSRTSPTYPRVIVETTATRDGQLATVTSTLDDSIQTADTGPLIESSEVTDLGDGRSIKVTTEVDEVFEQPSFTRAKEDLTPQKFRATVTETVEERTIPGTATMPASLTGDQISKTEEQLTLDRKRVRTQERAIGTTTSTLNEQVVTPDGQLATRTLTLSNQQQTVTPSATLLQGEVEQLGDGRTVRTVVTVPSVFDELRLAKEKPDLVPQEFRGAVPTETTEVVQSGVTATMPSLGPGELAKTVQRITANKLRTSVTTRPSTALPVTLTPSDTLIDGDGITVTRTKTLASGAQTFTPSATVSGSVENIGDGLTVKTVDVKANVFESKAFSIERPDPIPQKFRVLAPTQTVEETLAGDAAMPSLTSGQISKSEQQVNKFVKRTSTTFRNTSSSDPLVGQVFTTEMGGGIADVAETYPFNSTIPTTPEFGTVSDEIENLGDGTKIRRQVKLKTVKIPIGQFDENGNEQSVDALPLLVGQEYDQELDLVIPYKEIVAPPTSQLATGNRKRITPRDPAHSSVIRYDIEDAQDALDTYYFEVPEMTDISLPDILKSVTFLRSASASSGEGDGEGDTFYYSWSRRAAVGGTISYQIESGFSGTIPSIRAIFFLPKGEASPQDVLDKINNNTGLLPSVEFWPNVRPKSNLISISEMSEYAEESRSVSFDAFSVSNSSGGSFSKSSVTIPPCIHGDIQIVDTNQQPLPLGSVTVSPSSLTATAFPTFPTGNFLYRINANPYRFSYVRVDALIVTILPEYV